MRLNGTTSAGAPAADDRTLAAFSVDLEDYFQAEALRGFFPRERWREAEDRTAGNTARLLDLLDEFEIKATFFVLGWTARRHSELVKRVASAGHEVASHGYDHELIYHQEPDVFRRDVHRARALLQDLSGQTVAGYRAPSYTIMRRTWWALEILAEEGHTYDSSIFPIKRIRYGIPDAPRHPHRISLPGGHQIVEFPLPTLRFGFFNLPATGGAYLRLLPLAFQEWAVSRHLRTGRPLVLNVHPWELDPGQPRLPLPPRTRLTHYHNLNQTGARLRILLTRARFQPVSGVLETLGLLSEALPGPLAT